MITIDVSKLPHLEARQKALRDQAEVDRIEEEKENDPQLKELMARRSAARTRLYEEARARELEVLTPLDEQVDALSKPYSERMDAIKKGEVEFRINWDDDCRLQLCELSGLPIVEDEAVVEDSDATGGLIIRALLPFPAEQSDEEAA